MMELPGNVWTASTAPISATLMVIKSVFAISAKHPLQAIAPLQGTTSVFARGMTLGLGTADQMTSTRRFRRTFSHGR